MLEVHNISQLYVKEKVHTTKRGIRRGHKSYSYELRVLINNRKDISLLSSLAINSAEDATFLERKIEDYLKIEDANIKGEYKRGSKSDSWFG